MTRTIQRRRTLIYLLLDVALAAAFTVSFRPALIGLAVHEWLGLALGSVLAVRLILHWNWVAGVTRKLLKRLPLKTLPLKARVYYALDALLLAAFVTIIGSGVAMSRAVLPLLGLRGSASLPWAAVHNLASTLTLALLVVKLVLHREWIASAVRRVFGDHSGRRAYGGRGGGTAQRGALMPEPVRIDDR